MRRTHGAYELFIIRGRHRSNCGFFLTFITPDIRSSNTCGPCFILRIYNYYFCGPSSSWMDPLSNDHRSGNSLRTVIMPVTPSGVSQMKGQATAPETSNESVRCFIAGFLSQSFSLESKSMIRALDILESMSLSISCCTS